MLCSRPAPHHGSFFLKSRPAVAVPAQLPSRAAAPLERRQAPCNKLPPLIAPGRFRAFVSGGGSS